MFNLSRRSLIKGAGVAGLAGTMSLDGFATAWAQNASWKPEAGASLKLMRWKEFIPSEGKSFDEIVAAFTKATGVAVQVTREGLDDVQPKASVAAATGQGPDIVWGSFSLPQLFPSKCVPMDDLADYLGKKYGGWTEGPEAYVRNKDHWLGLPIATNGNYINYRTSAINKAGFKEIPADFDGFLSLCEAMKKNNTPPGFALGHATGDGNSFVYWMLWGFGAHVVDEKGKVTINSPETAKALEYGKKLYATFIPGTPSWNDGSNNKAFLAGELYLTANGISIYVAAKTAGEKGDAKMKALAEDINHAYWPVGPVGKIGELQSVYPMMAFNYTKYPNACKAFMAFMLEAAQYNKWLVDSQAYLTETLKAYDSNPVWTADPKAKVFKDASNRCSVLDGMSANPQKAAESLADFIVIDMFARYVTGQSDLKSTLANAERQTKRLFG
ncbi:MAG: extracellular solute-binding protein [Hyphomicrobiales bacterium]|nr:extracellular solute-binding protein [Hyphomicrobiales bacterium]MDE2113659.1 extracellular solute-binding protein [Hyphomicrobiales bacterium]